LAERPLDEDRQAEQEGDKQPVRPGAIADADQESGLEGFDLGQLLREPHREQRYAQQDKEDDVLEPLQAVMPFLWQGRLEALEADDARYLVDGFGQRAEGAHPAAEQTASEEKHGDDDEDPEQEDEGVGQKQRPGPLEEQGVEPGQDLRDGGLGHETETDEHDTDRP